MARLNEVLVPVESVDARMFFFTYLVVLCLLTLNS
jgi:hypothetical protein